MFNREKHPMTMTLRFQEIEVSGSARLHDLWAHKDLETFDGSYTTHVPGHGVVMLRVEK